MVQWAATKKAHPLRSLDSSCRLKEISKGEYVALGRQYPSPVHDDSEQTSGDGELRRLFDVLAMRISRWMYIVDFDEAGEAVPPESLSFKVGRDHVFTVDFSVTFFSSASMNTQEQRGVVVAVITGESLPSPLRVVLVGFRGTVRAQDWLGNLSPLLNSHPFSKYGIRVHSAWHGLVAPQRKQDQIHRYVEAEAKRGATHLIFTGHSMGGALAQISMMQILAHTDHEHEKAETKAPFDLLARATCATFASPLPFAPTREETLDVEGIKQQRRALHWMARRCVNFVNNNDVVARLPGGLAFLREIFETFRVPQFLVYGFARGMLGGTPVLRKYRPIVRIFMIGHNEVEASHPRLDMLPWDPECAKALLTRAAEDDTYDPEARPGIGKKLADWVTGGSVHAFVDHMPLRYEAYVEAACSVMVSASDQKRKKTVFFSTLEAPKEEPPRRRIRRQTTLARRIAALCSPKTITRAQTCA